MTTEELVCDMVDEIDRLRGDAIALLDELVRINSTNPNYPGADPEAAKGGEAKVNAVLEKRYRAAGLETHRVAVDDDRPNLVGLRRGTGAGRSLILNGHVDTVAGENLDAWRPAIRDGRMYGVGTCDMKGAAVAMWLVAQALHAVGVDLKGDLQLHSVVGEESGEHTLGTTAVLDAGFRADAAIVTEPTHTERGWIVSPVSAGAWYLRIVLEGKRAHPGNRWMVLREGGAAGNAIGVNALEKAVELVSALQHLEREWIASKRHDLFPEGFFTLMPGVLHADPGMPVPFYFPDRAKIEYILYHPPDMTQEDAARELEEHVRSVCATDSWLVSHPPEIEWIWGFPPMNTPWTAPIVQTAVRAREKITGEVLPPPSPAHPVNFGSAMDGTWLYRAGIPTVVFGPGDLAMAHSKDEHVVLEQVSLAAKVLAASVVDWCGVS